MEKCEKCGSEDGVMKVSIPVVNVNHEDIALCISCRIRIFDINILQDEGSPVSVTKKIELTFTEKDWEWIDEKSSKNYSRYFRNIAQTLKAIN